jgi:hypothetical protein
MKNMGLIPEMPEDGKARMDAMRPQSEASKNAIVSPSSFQMFERMVPKKEEVAPKPEGSIINMYINGNTIMNERDMDLLGNGIVRQLKLGGVK